MPSLDTIYGKLCEQVEALRFGAPVTHVYNPLAYARQPHRAYLRRYGGRGGRGSRGSRRVMLLGMNPGPWGMAQTGVPFGEVELVRDWLALERPVAKPPREHPKRPVQGFACPRSEVSGARLWGWARQMAGTPERFFEHFFVANYCPLCFMEESGRNRTPDKLPKQEQEPLFDACDRALRAAVQHLTPSHVVGVGAFAEARVRAALASEGLDDTVTIGRLLHPSPASPLANRGWAERATEQLRALGALPFG